MFNKKSIKFREGINTLVAVNTVLTGNIESEGTVKVDGKVKGEIRVNGDVYVGGTAAITGTIIADNVYLAGFLEGTIITKGILKILSTAKLYGAIKVNTFLADEGALFQGSCDMLDASDGEKTLEKSMSKINYIKSSVLDDVYEEKEKNKTKHE